MATPGNGTPHQVLTALLMKELGLKLYHVPYKGSAGITQDILGGRIDVAFLPVPVAVPMVASGAAILAAGGSQRTTNFPDAPTYAELGVQSLAQSDSWNGAFVNAATSPALVDKLSADLIATLREPQTAARIVKAGFTLAPAPARGVRQDRARHRGTLAAGFGGGKERTEVSGRRRGPTGRTSQHCYITIALCGRVPRGARRESSAPEMCCIALDQGHQCRLHPMTPAEWIFTAGLCSALPHLQPSWSPTRP